MLFKIIDVIKPKLRLTSFGATKSSMLLLLQCFLTSQLYAIMGTLGLLEDQTYMRDVLKSAGMRPGAPSVMVFGQSMTATWPAGSWDSWIMVPQCHCGCNMHSFRPQVCIVLLKCNSRT